MNFENLENKRFGMLTVLQLAPKTKNRSTRWLCKCDCGNTKIIRNKNLIEGVSKDCGCISKNNFEINQKIARLTLVKSIPACRGRKWECVCECGERVTVQEYDLREGIIKSCGCLKSEYAKMGNPIHKYNKTRIQRIHQGMMQRCYDKNHIHYSNYGGKGITVCEEWRGKYGVGNFAKWALQNGYNDELSIDRIDNNKGYSPDNCRWSTALEQANNTRRNRNIEYNGEVLSLSQMAKKHNMSVSMLSYRLKKWGDIDRAINEPLHNEKIRKKVATL